MAPAYPVPALNNTAVPTTPSAPPAYNATAAAAPVSFPVPTAGVSSPTQAAFNATAGPVILPTTSGWYFGFFSVLFLVTGGINSSGIRIDKCVHFQC